jgi:hypothetical protein
MGASELALRVQVAADSADVGVSAPQRQAQQPQPETHDSVIGNNYYILIVVFEPWLHVVNKQL